MPNLLETSGRVRAEDSKRVLLHHVDVPAGVEALALTFDYAPRRCSDPRTIAPLVDAAIETHLATHCPSRRAQVEPRLERVRARTVEAGLNNLLNVTLVDPNGVWRGRWDRNPSSDSGALTVGANAASKGFLPGAIVPGRWTVAVEIHGVFGEAVEYCLKIATSAEPEPSPRATSSIRPGTPHRLRWGEEGRRWYLGEMHAHTVHSDGAHELVELAHRASRIGLDFLCLTDHNATSGYREIDGLPLTIVRGSELTTFAGHHPFYGLERTEAWHEDGAVLPFGVVAARARSRGAFVSIAHPFKLGDPLCTGCRMTADYDADDVDAIEVWYRRWDGADWDDRAAYDVWNRAWAAGKPLTALAARDWHGPAQESPFPGEEPFTAVLADDDSEAAILAGLSAGRVIMTGGPLLTLHVGDAGIGDRIRAPAERSMRCELAEVEEGSTLVVLKDNEPFYSCPIDDDGPHAVDLDVPVGWYRAELRRDDAPRVITNHLVVEP